VLLNYTCVRRKKKFTQVARHITPAPGVCQMGSWVFSKESSNFRDRILTKIFTWGKPKLAQITGVKTY